MKTVKLLVISALTGVALAASTVAPAYAWHPEVKITKYVTNVTDKGEMADANNAADAVQTKPGDIIKYTIVVENTAGPASNAHNDLYFTKMVDELPDGVELVSDPKVRKITEHLGILKPGDKVTKEYTLKVTSTKDHDNIHNKACASGDSKVNDAPRNDCDMAFIRVNLPPKEEEPKEEPKEEEPQVLPATGAAGIALGAGAATVLGYAVNLIRLKRR